ncbi:hypothetical protein ACOMHN_029365 [Nucella lapillus]
MDDYREQLMELVRARPLLWDPHVADYKDKDQKAQVWENLNGRLNSPTVNTSLRVIEKCFHTVSYSHSFIKRSSSVGVSFQGKNASAISLYHLVGHRRSPVNHISIAPADEIV